MKNVHTFLVAWIKDYGFILLLLFYCFSFLYASDASLNQDLGRHLKLGEIIWNTKQIPLVNLFSYTFPDFPFVNHHWLFQVMVYLGSVAIGIQGLLIIKVLLMLSSVLLVLLITRSYKSLFFLVLGYLFLHLLRGRIDLRPEIVSFLFTTITFYILERYERTGTKLIYVLPMISLLWVNTHIYYPVGIFLQLIFLLHLAMSAYRKQWKDTQLMLRLQILSYVTFVSVLLLLINPNGLKGMLYAFSVFNNYGVTITENQTMGTLQKTGFQSPDFLFFYLATLLSGVFLFVSLFMNKFNLKNVLLLFLGLILSFQSIRGFPYLLFFGLPAVVSFVAIRSDKIWVKILNGFVIILIVIEAFYYLSGIYYDHSYRTHEPHLVVKEDAKASMDFFREHRLPSPIFNNFDIGSYVLYRTYPMLTVFIDGRPEAYPASFFTETYIPMQEDYTVFKKIEQKEQFKTIVISITDQNPRTVNLLRSLTKDPHWNLVYLDYFMVIYVVRNDALARNLPDISLSDLNTSVYRYTQVDAYTNLSTFLYNMNEFTKAEEMNRKALRLAPDNPSANKIMANILLRKEKPDLKRVYGYIEKSKVAFFW